MKVNLLHPLLLAVLVGACSTPATNTLPPPVAGLWHPAAVRVGQQVVFDASTTAAASAPASDPGAPGARVTGFRFEIATFPAIDQALPTLAWTFGAAGHYALRLVVTDDLGRQSSADSAIDVVPDLADACTGTTAPACASGACASGQCANFACAGDPACPALGGQSLTCDRGVCDMSGAVTTSVDAYGGEDVPTVNAADAGSP